MIHADVFTAKGYRNVAFFLGQYSNQWCANVMSTNSRYLQHGVQE